MASAHHENSFGISSGKYLFTKLVANHATNHTPNVSKHMKSTFRIYFLFILTLSNCANGQTEKQVSEFENILGKENLIVLKLLTADFEKDILKTTYPKLSIEKSYEKFLNDVKDSKVVFWNKVSPKSRDVFKKSDLRLEIYEFPDSVWIGKNGVESRYIFKNEDGTIDRNSDGTINYGFSLKSANLSKNLDSLIQKEYDTPRLKYSGKYLEAIRTIKSGNSFLEAFYEVKDNFGYISPSIMAGILIKNNPDFFNPITKELIVMEFGY